MNQQVAAGVVPVSDEQLQAHRHARRARFARRFGRWLRVIVLIIGAFILSIPILWMISTSLKASNEVFRYPPDIIPRKLVWHNYIEAFTYTNPWGTDNVGLINVPPLLHFTKNTIQIALVCVIGSVLSNSLVAYGFSRLRFWGRDVLFALMLATMMLPGQVTIIPIFVMFRSFGWLDTYYPLTVPSFFASAFYVFLFRQHIMTLPIEMDDAARIDGCNSFAIFWRIILPLSRPIITTIALFTFAGTWNDYFAPLIYLNSFEKWTISLGLANYTSVLGAGAQLTPYHLLMAAALVVSLPMILIFLFFQGTFVRSIVLTGLKG